MNNKYLDWLKAEIAANGPMMVKTRRGANAKIVHIEIGEGAPIVGFLQGLSSWRANGIHIAGSSSADIILPPMPSRVICRWVNVYETHFSRYYHNEINARGMASADRIGSSRKITINLNTGKITDITEDGE